MLPPIVTLSKVCSSPTRNSSSSAGCSALGGTACSQPCERLGVVEAVGRLRAGSGRRLGDQGEADLPRERSRLGGTGDQGVRGAGHARLRGARSSSATCRARCGRSARPCPRSPWPRAPGRAAPGAVRARRRGAPPGRSDGRARSPPRRSDADRGRSRPASARTAVAQRSVGSVSSGSQVINPSRTPGSAAASATNRAVASMR